MKKIAKIFLIAVAIIIIISVGGCAYFYKKFAPPPNYLTLKNCSQDVPIKWLANKSSPISALLLPVFIEGVEVQFYMQFDLGTHSTVLYKNSLLSIDSIFSGVIPKIDSTSYVSNLTLKLGEMSIVSKKFKVLNFGKSFNGRDTASMKIIGTIGADVIENKVLILDFKNGTCNFGDSLPRFANQYPLYDFHFDFRKVLFPGTVNGKKYKLLYDTGTSGFEFITSKRIWEKMSKKDAIVRSYDANSWGKPLTTYTVESDKKIYFEPAVIRLGEVTYIEGASFFQKALMRMSGMGGMIGNKLFMGKKLILDCKNKKYTIID